MPRLENHARMKYLQYRYKLEIWGKAKRESTRRPKSDWGKKGGG